jgi:hypothetical protein
LISHEGACETWAVQLSLEVTNQTEIGGDKLSPRKKGKTSSKMFDAKALADTERES